MADDDDKIYVDLVPKLDEDAAESESHKLRDKFKRSAKVKVQPELDEDAAEKTHRHLRDILHRESKVKVKPEVDDRDLGDVTKKLSHTLGGALDKVFDGKGIISDLNKELQGALNLGDLFGGKVNIGGLDLGAGVGDALSNSLKETLKSLKLPTNFEEGVGTLESALEKLGPSAAAAAGPIAALAITLGAIGKGVMDIIHSTDPNNGFIRPQGQEPVQTPGGQMALPGQHQPAMAPPGAPPGTQYRASEGDINDPFAAALPPGGLPAVPHPIAPKSEKSPGLVLPGGGFVPSPPGLGFTNIAPPDTGGGVKAGGASFSSGASAAPSSLTAALQGAGIDPRMYPMLQGFAAAEGKNPSGAFTLGFTDSQAGTSLQSHAQALSQQIQSRTSVAGQFPAGGSLHDQAAWMATVVGQQGVASDWQGNAQPSREDYISRVMGGAWAPAAPSGFGGGGAHAGAGGMGRGFGMMPKDAPEFPGPSGSSGTPMAPAMGGGGGAPGLGGGSPGPGMPALGQSFLPPSGNQSGAGINPQGATPGQGSPPQQQQLGSGKGFGISGGLIGGAEQAGVMAAGIGGFGGGAIAAQIAEQEINLAIQKGGQAAATLAAAPFETLGLAGGQMGAESVNVMGGWGGKFVSGLMGASSQLPNVSGAAQKPKDPQGGDQQQGPGKDGQQKQSAGPKPPTGHEDDPIHVKSSGGGGGQNQQQGAQTSGMSTISPALSVMTA